MWVARRDDDSRRDLGAVGAHHAADRVALAGEVGDLGVEQQDATGSDECPTQGLGHHSAAADGPPDLTDVTNRVRQRAETGAGALGRDAPHHRARHHRRTAQRLGGEEAAHDIGRAAPAPAQQRRRTAAAPGDHLLGDRRDRRRVVGIVEHHLHRRHRRLHVPSVAVDLGRVGAGERVDRLLDVVVDRPHRPAVPGHVALRRIDVDVLQSVSRQVELFDHRGRAERDVVAVADVDRSTAERLARGRAADRRSGLDQQGAQAGFGQVGGADQPVVTGADDHGVVVVDRSPFHSGRLQVRGNVPL